MEFLVLNKEIEAGNCAKRQVLAFTLCIKYKRSVTKSKIDNEKVNEKNPSKKWKIDLWILPL